MLSRNVPVTFQDVSDETAVTLHETEEAIKIFLKQNMLDEEDGLLKVTNWDKRQFTSDYSTQRVRKYREKKRKGNVSETPPDTDTDTDLSSSKSLSAVKKAYEQNMGVLTPIVLEGLEDWIKDLPADVILTAIERAAKANKRQYNYLNGILNNWHKAGLKTIGAIKAQEGEVKNEQVKQYTKKTPRNTKGKYDDIDFSRFEYQDQEPKTSV